MFCSKCGREQVGNPKFCRNCGEELRDPGSRIVQNGEASVEQGIRIRVITTRGIVLRLLLAWLVFELTAFAGLSLLAVYICGVIYPDFNPNLAMVMAAMLPLLTIALMLFITLIILFIRNRPKSRNIISLAPVGKRDFVMVSEGIYIRLRSRLWSHAYYFYPWNILRYYAVDEKNEVVGLKSGRQIFRFKTEGDFKQLRDTISSHVRDGGEGIGKGVGPRFRVHRFVLVVCILVAVHVVALVLYGHLPTGRPGDGRCDVCGVEAWHMWKETDANGITVREYCDNHAGVYFILRPDKAVEAIASRHLTEYGNSTPTSALICTSVAWLIMLSFAVWFSTNPWHRAWVWKQ